MTEILLSLLTEASNLRRQVVDQVFNIIVPHLTSSALKIILEVRLMKDYIEWLFVCLLNSSYFSRKVFFQQYCLSFLDILS